MTRRRNGFTLLELLIVIGLIALLITLLAVALSGVRRGAERTESIAALRQLVTAYATYSTDHEHRLLPGYVDPANMATSGYKARIEDGGEVLANADGSSYVWRLAPYFDYQWEAVMKDYQNASMQASFGREFSEGAYGPDSLTGVGEEFGISRYPSYGLNSIFAGGDDRYVPASSSLVAKRMSQVQNPAMMIVFGASAHNDQGAYSATSAGSGIIGTNELRSPYLNFDGTDWNDEQWIAVKQAGEDPNIVAQVGGAFAGTDGDGGVPVARLRDGKVPIGLMDGSASFEDLSALGGSGDAGDDAGFFMRRWSAR